MQRGADLAAARGCGGPTQGSSHVKAVGKAVVSAVLSIVALVLSCAIAASETSAVETTVLAGIALFIAFIGAWGAFICLHAERYFNHFAVISGLVLGALPLVLTLTSQSLGENRSGIEPDPTTATTTTSAASSPGVRSRAPAGEVDPVGTPHVLWAGESSPFCMNGPSGESGSWLWASPCDDALAMDWKLTTEGQLRGGTSDVCVTLLGSFEAGKAVTTAPCGRHGQRWWPDGERLRNEKGGCLDVDTTGDMHLLVRDCNGSLDQSWLWD